MRTTNRRLLCNAFGLLAILATAVFVGGCMTVARTPNGEWIAAIPLSGEIAESNWTKAGNAASQLSPLADLVVPGAGVAIASVLGALGYGVHRGKKTTEAKYELADEWYEDGLSKPQAQPTITVAAVPAPTGAAS